MGPRETFSLSLFQLIRGSGKFLPVRSSRTAKALSHYHCCCRPSSSSFPLRVVGGGGQGWIQRKYEKYNKEGDGRTSLFRLLTLSPLLLFWFSGVVANCEDKEGHPGSKNKNCTDIATATKKASSLSSDNNGPPTCSVSVSGAAVTQAQLLKSAQEQGILPPAVKSSGSGPPALPVSKGNKGPLNWCEDADLSHKTLVRQSCQLGVDSVTRILCETVAAYQDIHEKYRRLLDRIIDGLERSRTAEGVQLEVLDCKLIMMRAEVEEMKGRIIELECFLGSIQRLSDAMAETAFVGNAEYHSVAMSERLDSALREIRAVKEETARKERDMIEIQTVVIVESGRGLK